MSVVLLVLVGLLMPAGGDFVEVADPPKDPSALVVAGKVTVVVVGLEGCPSCDAFNEQASATARAMEKLAIRYVDGAHDNALAYMPKYAPVPYARVYDQKGKEAYAGPVGDGVLVKTAVFSALGVSPGGIDPAVTAACQGCATKTPYEEKDVVAQPGAKVGDLARCPVSGVVFQVTETSPVVTRDGGPLYVCCAMCQAKAAADAAAKAKAPEKG